MNARELINILNDEEILELKIHYIGIGNDQKTEKEYIEVGAESRSFNIINNKLHKFNRNEIEISYIECSNNIFNSDSINSGANRDHSKDSPYLLNVKNGSANLIYENTNEIFLFTCYHVINNSFNNEIISAYTIPDYSCNYTIIENIDKLDVSIISFKKDEFYPLQLMDFKTTYFKEFICNEEIRVTTTNNNRFKSRVKFHFVKYTFFDENKVFYGKAGINTGNTVRPGDSGSTVFSLNSSHYNGIVTGINASFNGNPLFYFTSLCNVKPHQLKTIYLN